MGLDKKGQNVPQSNKESRYAGLTKVVRENWISHKESFKIRPELHLENAEGFQ